MSPLRACPDPAALVRHDPAGVPEPVVQQLYEAARPWRDRGPQGAVTAAPTVLAAPALREHRGHPHDLMTKD